MDQFYTEGWYNYTNSPQYKKSWEYVSLTFINILSALWDKRDINSYLKRFKPCRKKSEGQTLLVDKSWVSMSVKACMTPDYQQYDVLEMRLCHSISRFSVETENKHTHTHTHTCVCLNWQVPQKAEIKGSGSPAMSSKHYPIWWV